MARQDDLDIHLGHALHDRVEIIDLKPQQNSVSVWFVLTIRDGAVMMFHVEAVQLENQVAIGYQLLIRGSAMIAAAAEQALIPAAACLDVSNGD